MPAGITFFEELLKKDESVTIHQRNLRILATETFMTKNRLKPETMKNIFNFIESAHHLRSNNRLERHDVKSVRYGTETISHLGPKMWNLLPEEYKEINYLIPKEKFQIGKQMNVFVEQNIYTTPGFYLNVHLPSNSSVHARDS